MRTPVADIGRAVRTSEKVECSSLFPSSSFHLAPPPRICHIANRSLWLDEVPRSLVQSLCCASSTASVAYEPHN